MIKLRKYFRYLLSLFIMLAMMLVMFPCQAFAVTVVPSVTTSAATWVTSSGATLNGGISSNGNGSITDFGFYWGTGPSPSNKISVGVGMVSTFIWDVSVTPGTTYYFKAYATNQAGTGYGSVMSFSVPGSPPPIVVVAPSVTTSAATWVTSSGATLNGGISSSGNGSITDFGFYWGTGSSPSNKISVGVGMVSTFIWDVSVTPGTTYYFKAYATNQAGTGYGSVMSFSVPGSPPPIVVVAPSVTTSAATWVTSSGATLNGGISSSGNGSITDFGFYWGTGSSPSNKISVGVGMVSTFIWDVSLTPGVNTYYFKAYATNQAGTSYGSVMSFNVPGTQPTVVGPSVTTNAATQVTATQATLNGSITSAGGGSISDYGFYWGTSSSPSTQVSVGSGTTSSFSWNASVTPGTTYYFEAYATNQAGTGYGSVMSFTVPATQPTVGAPTVTTSAADDITGTSATLCGSITSNGNGEHH